MPVLKLTRKPGERILISMPDGTQVWVSWRRGGHDKPQLVIEAPMSVVITREELLSPPEVPS